MHTIKYWQWGEIAHKSTDSGSLTPSDNFHQLFRGFFGAFLPTLQRICPAYLQLCNAFCLPLQDLEEELELDRRRVSEAEGVAKRAEEELAVAKERLLLQEDELQNRAGTSVRLPPSAWNGLVQLSLGFHNSF